MVWNTNRDEDYFEPGANYHVTGAVLSIELYRKINYLFKTQEPNSPLALELQHRKRFIDNICYDHQALDESPYWTWWGTRRSANTISATNVTATSKKNESHSSLLATIPLTFTS